MATTNNNRLLSQRPPRLPTAPGQYEARFHDQHSDVLRLYFNQLDNVVATLLGPNGGQYVQSPHALLMSAQDQGSAGVTAENIITYNTPIIEQGVEVRSGSEIWFDAPGQYLVSFSLQFTNRGNAAQEIEVWAKQDGVNFPLSNTRFDIAARKSTSVWSHAVANVTGIFTVIDPSDTYLRLAWWSNGADVFLEYYPEGTNPTRPAIPSVIVTVNLISRLP
jgi:hypothetical protein